MYITYYCWDILPFLVACLCKVLIMVKIIKIVNLKKINITKNESKKNNFHVCYNVLCILRVFLSLILTCFKMCIFFSYLKLNFEIASI